MRQTLNMSPAGTTQMIYDVWDHLLAEYDGGGTIQKLYIWVGDEPVAVVDWTVTGSPLLLYVHTDHLHRPEMMTDGSGNVVWRASYEPFGAVSSISGSVTENRRFPGQYFQLEAGLAYNWHRHYDPTVGRYTSPDPLGLFLSPTFEAGVSYDVNSYMLPFFGESDLNNELAIMMPFSSNERLVVHSGSSAFGYANEDPLYATDNNGLLSSFSSSVGSSSNVQLCAKKKPPANGPKCEGVCSLGTPGGYIDPNTGNFLCPDCFLKKSEQDRQEMMQVNDREWFHAAQIVQNEGSRGPLS